MSKNIAISYFKTPVGELILGSYNNKLCVADWRYRKKRLAIDNRIQKQLEATFVLEDTAVIKETKRQLSEYFIKNLKYFEIPLLLVGTPFQRSVWKTLQNIPFGETCSYLQLSKNLGNEKAVRAVATANGANAISIIIPCHRIIGNNGDLVGYAGGLLAKHKLLVLENAINKEQLSLF